MYDAKNTGLYKILDNAYLVPYDVYMLIQITAYLRTEEDLEKWKAISNKTAFLHDALKVQGTRYPNGVTKVPGGKVIVSEVSKIINTPEQAQKATDEITRAVTYTKPEPTA